jgi:tetratricopeptide (TPR) repeat protein
LRKRLAVSEGELAATNLLATFLIKDAENVEAVKVMKVAAEKHPEDKGLMIRLGRAEMMAGQKSEGTATLVALLKDATDAEMLNDAAYELANADVELDLAKKSCEKALEILTTESASWTLDGDAKSQAAKSTLLVATWDTMGWILFREGKLDEAEGYVRASWHNNWQSEVGMHLGEIEEARGNREAALQVYHLAQRNETMPNGAAVVPSPVMIELKRRINALEQKGVKSSSTVETSVWEKLKRLRADDSDHESGLADYEILLSEGRVSEIRPSPNAATVVKGGMAKVRGVDFKSWTPPGSKAKLRLRGLLNCHNNVCELERLPI